MRFPWLQVDTDFIDSKASELGALLGVSRREAAGLALDLWKWVLARSPSDRAPDGILTGSAPVPVLASAVSWPEPERLVSALVEVGLVERIPDGLRIRGLSRYKATWEKNRRNPKRVRSGTEPEQTPDPDRKTQTEKKKEATTLAGSADAAPPVAQQASLLPAEAPKAAKQRKPPEPKPEPKGDPRHHPLKLRVMEIFREVTGHPYGFGGIDAKALSNLLALTDQSPSTAGDAAPVEIERRWRIGLAWTWGAGEKPVQNLSALHRRWNDCAAAHGPSAATGTAIPAHLMRRAETHRDALLALPEGELPIPD